MDITTDTIITSDYVAVVFGIRAPKPLSEKKSTKYRRWKLLNLDSFKAGLSVSDIPYWQTCTKIANGLLLGPIMQKLPTHD